MANLETSELQIAGIGHVYLAEPGTDLKVDDLNKFKFRNGSEITDFTWLGDVSSENLPEFESDGGDTSSKRTWDRVDVRTSREPKTHSMTLHAVNVGRDTIETAFPGSKWNEAEQSYDVNLDGSAEKAVLIVVVDGDRVAAHLFPRVSMAGDLPALDLEEFTEITISGAVTTPADGGSKYRYFLPRQVSSAAVTPTPKPGV